MGPGVHQEVGRWGGHAAPAIKPRVGDGVLFYNVDADTGAELSDSLHAGEPVSSGTKWVCNAWVRFDHTTARA